MPLKTHRRSPVLWAFGFEQDVHVLLIPLQVVLGRKVFLIVFFVSHF